MRACGADDGRCVASEQGSFFEACAFSHCRHTRVLKQRRMMRAMAARSRLRLPSRARDRRRAMKDRERQQQSKSKRCVLLLHCSCCAVCSRARCESLNPRIGAGCRRRAVMRRLAKTGQAAAAYMCMLLQKITARMLRAYTAGDKERKQNG